MLELSSPPPPPASSTHTLLKSLAPSLVLFANFLIQPLKSLHESREPYAIQVQELSH